MSRLLALATVLAIVVCTLAQTGSRMNSQNVLPAGYWPLEKSQEIIDKTQTITLAPDGERKAVEKLLEVGKIFQNRFEQQRHPQAHSSFIALAILLLILTVVSWYFRPADRKIISVNE